MKAWKSFEKQVAEKFGGIRRIRVSYNESVGDVIHDKYSIECKYGKQIPKYCNVKHPTLLYTKNHQYELVPDDMYPNNFIVYDRIDKNIDAQFLEEAFEQARQYDETKEAIVCVKPRSKKGFIIIKRVF